MNVDQRILGVAGHLVGGGLTGMSVLRRGGRNIVLQARGRSAAGPGELVIKGVAGSENLLPNERAAHQFLAATAATRPFVPRLLGSTPDAGILVFEHVPGETLEAVFASADAARARQAVLEAAYALGRLHAATRGRRDEWLAISGARGQPLARQGEGFRELAPTIIRFCERAGLRLPAGFREELGVIGRTLEQPGEWLAFTLGDLAPSNVIVGREGPVFVDLEYADFRHAGYDAAWWHAMCPFPGTIAEQADRAHHSGWCDAATEAGHAALPDEAVLHEQIAIMAGHRAFWSLTWNAAPIWDADFEDVPGVSARLLRRLWLRGFARVARRARVLPVLATIAQDLDAALGREWPETNAPVVLFPAFAGLPWDE